MQSRANDEVTEIISAQQALNDKVCNFFQNNRLNNDYMSSIAFINFYGQITNEFQYLSEEEFNQYSESLFGAQCSKSEYRQALLYTMLKTHQMRISPNQCPEFLCLMSADQIKEWGRVAESGLSLSLASHHLITCEGFRFQPEQIAAFQAVCADRNLQIYACPLVQRNLWKLPGFMKGCVNLFQGIKAKRLRFDCELRSYDEGYIHTSFLDFNVNAQYVTLPKFLGKDSEWDAFCGKLQKQKVSYILRVSDLYPGQKSQLQQALAISHRLHSLKTATLMHFFARSKDLTNEEKDRATLDAVQQIENIRSLP